MTLSDAIEMRFPAEDTWARRAVARLGEIEEGTPIHDVAHGWLRFGGADGVLVDTLYVLTADRLGFGQTTAETGQPVWVDLGSIRALDAIEGLPYPLQSVEIQLNGDVAMLVGWPPEFCEKVVEVLVASTAAADDEVDALTGPFADPSTAADEAEVAELASLGPSELVEAEVQPVEEPSAETAPVEESSVETAPVEESFVEIAPVEESFVEIAPVEESFVETAPVEEEPDGFGPVDPELEDRVERFFLDADAEPIPVVDHSPADGPAPAGSHPGGTPAAFTVPGIQWPEPFRPVVYFGDHPEHPRRKKNVTLAFSPSGITAVASGIGTWKIHLSWDEVADLSFEHADEVKFTHNHRIHMNSTAVVVVLEDGAHMVFEVRGRKPAGMRSSLAPLVNALHQHRGAAASPVPEGFPTFGDAPGEVF